MWCTQCNTAWDWKSGNIETKIHNPHYFEYLRTLNPDELIDRNPLEVRCGREMDGHFISSILNSIHKNILLLDVRIYILGICQHLSHTINVDLRRYARNVGEPETLSLRINYMRGKITEDYFKRRVQMLYKKHAKNKEIYDILSMFTQTVTEILYRYRDMLDNDRKTELEATIGEITPLTEYANKCLSIVGEMYNSTKLRVSVTSTHSIGLYTV
jgi:hypothetical protein